MKLLSDLFPIILFFVAYKFFGLYVATAVAMTVATIQVVAHWMKTRTFATMQIITMVLILVLGGATLFFHNELFIKWKPTAINWAFALAFILSQIIGKQPLIKRLLGTNISLPAPIWLRLNWSWVVFFMLMGTANLYVIYNFDTNTWVNFKLFGVLGLTVLFVIIQAIYLTRHIEEDKTLS